MIPNFRITSKSSGVPVNLDKHKEIRDISSKATRRRIYDLSGDSKKPRLHKVNSTFNEILIETLVPLRKYLLATHAPNK